MEHGRYQLRTTHAEQQGQWDRFVADHPHGHLLQSWGWGDLKAGGGWRPLRLALWDEERGAMTAAAQVLQRTVARAPLLAGHLAYIPRGPLLDWEQPQMCAEFFRQLNRYLRRHGALALRLEPSLELEVAGASSMRQSFAAMSLYPVPAIQPRRTIILDLPPGDQAHQAEEALLAGMKEKWRYNLRLAERRGVRVYMAESEAEVRAWYAVLQATSRRDGFGIHTLDYYLRAWRIFVPRGQARLFLATYEGELLAGIFVGLCARQAIYLYGASSNERRNLMPNYLLQWRAIQWALQEGATSYDFWGIPETDDAHAEMAGVYRFKRGWGGRVVRFVGCFEQVYRPLSMRVATKLF